VNVRPQSIRQVGSGKNTARRLRPVVGLAASLGAVLLFATGPLQRADGAPVRSATANHPPAGLQLALDKLVADGQPGVIVMTRRGSDVSHVTAGVADRATGLPMQPQDRLHIGSITKTFVATVILQLVAERRLSLHDSVQRWLPGVIVGHGYHPERMTIRELLQHTSGLRDYTNLASPSVAWTAGAMISTVDDVARFYRALLTGRLLPPAEQHQLLSTIPVNDTGELFPEHYGLGIYRVHLPCGTAWGHDGGYPGFKTFAYTNPNGERQAVMVFNGFQMFLGKYNPVFRHDLTVATNIAFCAAHA
jgi:CubicO group peptidase (beta-lactamase class C family)